MADIIFTFYLILLGGYGYMTYSKRCEKLRFELWKRGVWFG